MECATCHEPITGKAIKAKVGPITLPLCSRCAKIGEFAVNVIHNLLR